MANLKLTPKVRAGDGWVLLSEGEPLREGDGFLHHDYDYWIDFKCRPDLFRGNKQFVHSGWMWRRKNNP